MATYDKIETENPLLDEILYNVKLMMKTCLLKNQEEADRKETDDSAKNGDLFVKIWKAEVLGTGKYSFLSFDDYEYMDFYNAGVYDQATIDEYLDDYDVIPDVYKQRIAMVRARRFIDNFEETNEYYRRITGLPPMGDPGLFLTEDILGDVSGEIDTSIPLHKQPRDCINLLKLVGVLDKCIENNPDKYYLKYIEKNISLYDARIAEAYELLYVNESLETRLVTQFKEQIKKNAEYVSRTIVSEAYSLYNNYYDAFIIAIIISLTVCDMVNSLADYYNHRDVFDIRTCQYFIESNGIEYFPKIPLKYQIRIVKSLNNLIKYKSTERSIKHIASIFNQKDIIIYQYYLNKYRVQDGNGNYIISDNIEEMYNLRFIKVPLGEDADLYIKNPSNYVNYTEVTGGDKYWAGPYRAEDIKRNILEKDFNVIKSKYLSLDAIYSLTELTFQMAYFNNMLMYSDLDFSRLYIEIPGITDGSKLTSLFAFLYSLSYKYYGREDSILYDMSSILYCRGFNFDVDLAELEDYLYQKNLSFEDLKCEGFSIPQSGILSLNQMMQIFINNKRIYEFIEEAMYNAETHKEFDAYEKIKDAMFVSEINYDLYYIPELARTASTYKEYLQYTDTYLYNLIVAVDALYIEGAEEQEDMKDEIYRLTTIVTEYFSNIFDSEDFMYIFNNLPTDTASSIMGFMQQMINFFKSYKITMLDMQNVYLMDRDYVYINDRAIIWRVLTKFETIAIRDSINLSADFKWYDKVEITDDIDIIEYH